jgi:thiol-disulfide isomerase/thioredoxin
MKKWMLVLAVAIGAVALHAQGSAEAIEKTLAEMVAAPQVTIVHLWAPWCPNCRHEMTPDGWAKFVADNPQVKVVFVNIWHKGQDGAPKLAAAGLGGQANFVALTHPNPSTKRGEQLSQLLGLPVGWVPTTWVFRAGKLRYAINYGEVRFDMLQQMVNDATAKW